GGAGGCGRDGTRSALAPGCRQCDLRRERCSARASSRGPHPGGVAARSAVVRGIGVGDAHLGRRGSFPGAGDRYQPAALPAGVVGRVRADRGQRVADPHPGAGLQPLTVFATRPRPRTRTQRTCPPCTRTLRTRTQRTCTPCTRTLRTRTQRTCTPCTRTLRTCTPAAARGRSRLPLHARRAPTPQLTHRTSEGELN